MLNRVKEFILRYNLLDKKSLYIVALSGGADSVCLLVLMKRLNYNVHAAHCNFNLRGAESERDEIFCRELCREYDIPFHFTHFDTRTYAELHKISIEMAARDLRYSYFEQLRGSIGASGVIVAHHKNDRVETFLMNMLRGTGIKGLESIKPINGNIIRPLLCVNRHDIENFLSEIGQEYVTDSSNLVDDVLRNKIRLNLVPMLEEIYPKASENICRTIENVSESVKIVEDSLAGSIKQCTEIEGKEYKIDINELIKQPSPETVLYTILTELGFTPSVIKSIYSNIHAQSGKKWYSNNYILAKDREYFKAFPVKESEKLSNIDIAIPEEGKYEVLLGCYVDIRKKDKEKDFVPSKDRYYVTIDADKVTYPLTLRNYKPGERFQPYGMKGKILVSDYLTNKKRDFFHRMHQLVLLDCKGNILWLVGERISERCACTESTIKILEIRYSNNEE